MANYYSNSSALPEISLGVTSEDKFDGSDSKELSSMTLSVFGFDETLSSNEVFLICSKHNIHPEEMALYNDPHTNRDFWKMTFDSLDECITAYDYFNSRDMPAQNAEYFTYDKCVRIKCLIVSRTTDQKSLAGAIAHAVRDGDRVTVYAGGEVCVYTASKAVLIARDYLRDDNYQEHGELLNAEKIDLWYTVHKSNSIGGIKFTIYKSLGTKVKLTDNNKMDWVKVSGASAVDKLSGKIVKDLFDQAGILMLACMGMMAMYKKILALIAVSEEINQVDGSILLMRSDFVRTRMHDGPEKKNVIVTEVYRFIPGNMRIQAGYNVTRQPFRVDSLHNRRSRRPQVFLTRSKAPMKFRRM